MLNFNFSEKGPGIVSPPHFVYDFSRKIFLENIFLFLKIFQEKIDIILIFLIKPFPYTAKKSRQKT